MKYLRPVMLAGTGSDVGKSVLATALCRIFVQDGYRPAPFKAQNMALNSYATPDGREIGRAQAVQAEACRLAPHVDMNPLLLKPNSDHTSQVVLLGKPIGNFSARQYWTEKTLNFRDEACKAFDRLAAQYSPIVLEGAGSISELNLRDHDLVNLPMARHADAAVILVADIDRGGVFASCYGSIMLQEPEDRARIRGIIVNKFRGDISLFEEGRKLLEKVCGVPVLGVVPYLKDVHIDAEDSVALEGKREKGKVKREKRLEENSEKGKEKSEQCGGGFVNVVVVKLPHISNFTDFDALERDARVRLIYGEGPEDIEAADIVILPGTKATLSDLDHLRRSGMAGAVLRAHDAGKTVMGICGGYQMLGQSIVDPQGVEGVAGASVHGLGLLPITTTMAEEKTTRQVTFDFDGHACHGYEIHQGQSTATTPFVIHDRCIGTYIHGCLDNAPVRDFLIGRPATSADTLSPEAFRQQQYDLLAEHVRRYVDIPRLYDILTKK